MSDKQKHSPETDEDVFNIFLDLFDAAAPETNEEIDDFLRQNGYDPDELARSARDIFKEALENSPLDWRNRARLEIADQRAKSRQRQPRANRSHDELIAALTSIQQKRGAMVAAHFRKLDLNKMTDEDLASLLDDLEYLDAENAESDE